MPQSDGYMYRHVVVSSLYTDKQMFYLDIKLLDKELDENLCLINVSYSIFRLVTK